MSSKRNPFSVLVLLRPDQLEAMGTEEAEKLQDTRIIFYLSLSKKRKKVFRKANRYLRKNLNGSLYPMKFYEP